MAEWGEKITQFLKRFKEFEDDFSNKMDKGRFYSGLILAVLGSIIMIIPILIKGLPTFQSLDPYVNEVILAIGVGVYFLGISVILDSFPKNNPELSEISGKIDNLQPKKIRRY